MGRVTQVNGNRNSPSRFLVEIGRPSGIPKQNPCVPIVRCTDTPPTRSSLCNPPSKAAETIGQVARAGVRCLLHMVYGEVAVTIRPTRQSELPWFPSSSLGTSRFGATNGQTSVPKLELGNQGAGTDGLGECLRVASGLPGERESPPPPIRWLRQARKHAPPLTAAPRPPISAAETASENRPTSAHVRPDDARGLGMFVAG